MESEGVVFCRKCGAELVPGRGDFYVVNIEAYAEAGVLRITAEDLAKDQAAAMREIVEELKGVSAQEAMDSVYRRVSFYLCRGCYAGWIEEPMGK